MKITLTSFVLAFSILSASALSWTNYPYVTNPAATDTLMIGTTTTNKQWRVSDMLSMTGTNAQTRVNAASNSLVSLTITTSNNLVTTITSSTNGLASTNYANSIVAGTSNAFVAMLALKASIVDLNSASNGLLAAFTLAKPVTNVLSFQGLTGTTIDGTMTGGPGLVKYSGAFVAAQYTGPIVKGYRTNILNFPMIVTNTTSVGFTLNEFQAAPGYQLNTLNNMSGAVAGPSSATTNTAIMSFTNVVAGGFTNSTANYRIINGSTAIVVWGLTPQSVCYP